MSFDTALVAKGLSARLSDVAAARERHLSFVFAPGRDVVADGGGAAAARDLVRRALTVLADPVNDELVRRLADGDASVAELADVVGLPALAAWERVNDLVQVGLVRHALDGDRAGLTGAGQALAELVSELSDRVAQEHRR